MVYLITDDNLEFIKYNNVILKFIKYNYANFFIQDVKKFVNISCPSNESFVMPL